MNPAKELATWLGGLPSEVSADIAFFMGVSMPDINDALSPTATSAERTQRLVEKVAEHETGRPIDMGFLISFAALFDFLLVRSRGTAEAWEQPRRMFEDILASEDPAHEVMKETARSSLEGMPERQEMWIKVCKEWATLKARALSPDLIERWGEDYMRTLRPPRGR